MAPSPTIPKPRLKVKAGSRPTVAGDRAPVMRYLRGDNSGVLSAKQVSLRHGAIDVNEAARRASALAWDFMQNSGWIAGAADQVIADTIGEELKFSYKPKGLESLGYSEEDGKRWAKEVEDDFRDWFNNAKEIDLAGEKTGQEMADSIVRFYLSGGEAFAIADYLPDGQRQAYACQTATKFTLVPGHRLSRETNKTNRIEQGIFRDQNKRAVGYRFNVSDPMAIGTGPYHDVAAFDGIGLPMVGQFMDRSANPDSPRGISPMAPAFNRLAQQDLLASYTLTTALAQSQFAATLKSPEASREAFEAITALEEEGDGQFTIGEQLRELWEARLDYLKNQSLDLSSGVKINHLAPGEEFNFHSNQTPNTNYVPFNRELHRETARCLAVAPSAYMMDFSNATYSSIRMEGATIWPMVIRRRNRVISPFPKMAFALWLDERIARGLTVIKGGYAAFTANRDALTRLRVMGPGKPNADDVKAAEAARSRIQNGTSSLQRECALEGNDYEQIREERRQEIKDLAEDMAPNFYERVQGGGPNGGAREGNRDPAQPKEEDQENE